MHGLSIISVAKTFLYMESTTQKKLQKLCYFAYSWYLTLYSERLFLNDFEAWIHGPNSPTLHNEYQKYTWRKIPQERQLPEDVNEDVFKFLQKVYEAYADLSEDSIEDLSHFDDPVIEARKGIPDYESSTNCIEDHKIVEYYQMVYKYYHADQLIQY